MVRACLSLLAGVYGPQLSSFPPTAFHVLAAVSVCIVLLVLRQTVVLLCGGVGVLLFLTHASMVVDGRLETRFAGDSVLTDIRITDITEHWPNQVRLAAAPVADGRLPGRLRLSWRQPPVRPALGDVWRVELRLKRPRGYANPGSFDYEGWLFRQRTGAIGYVVNGRHNHLLGSDGARFDRTLRERVAGRTDGLFDNAEIAAVLKAIAVGLRDDMSAGQWQRYARSGTSHLMAISGLHVGLAAGLGYVVALIVLGACRFRGNARDASLLCGVLVAASYTAISGFGVPAQRATLMLMVGSGLVLSRSMPATASLLAAAAVVIVAIDPLVTMSAGFMLSFLAVATLLWLARRGPPMTRGSRLRAIAAGVQGLLTLQVMLFFALLPVTVLLFQRAAFAAPIVNLVAVPVFSVVTVPLTLGGMLFGGLLTPVGDALLLLAGLSVGWIERLIAAVLSLPGTDITLPAIEGALLLQLPLLALWAALPRGWPGRGVAMLALVAAVLWRPATPEPGCVAATFLDVGQGLAVVVETDRHVAIYDVGPAFPDGGSLAESIVLPFLHSRGIRRVDRLILSHADLDHAGGVTDLLRGVEVLSIDIGEPLDATHSYVRHCTRGDGWYWNDVRFSYLHPSPGDGREGNDASCVLLVEAGGTRLLLSGDIEADVEHELVRQRVLPAVDVLSMPHHGSRTSSTLPFVVTSAARLVVVPAAHANRWGFPKPDVVDRWRRHGTDVIATGDAGAVQVRLCPDERGIVPVSFRDRRRRIWHER